MKKNTHFFVLLAAISATFILSGCHGSAWTCKKPEPVVEEPAPLPPPEPKVEAPPALCQAQPVQVYFETNRFVLTNGSANTMDELASCLAKNPDQRVTIEGHADIRGTAANNQKLSQRRADFVRDYLLQHGAPEASIGETIGRGATEAFGAGRSQEALAANRTTTVTVVR